MSLDRNGDVHEISISTTMKEMVGTGQVGTGKNDITISFLRSARSGDLEKVIELLESRQIRDINCCNANGLNALHLASKDGYVEIVKELLRRGINVNFATKKGNTALHIASLAGQLEVVKVLLHYKANVNVQSANGFTPLYMAAQENHYDCVKELLTCGALPSIATEDGFTPLAVAMQQGNDHVVALLLESDERGKLRLPALHIAAKKNDVAMAKLLLANLKIPDIRSKSGFTPLHIAAHYGNVQIAEMLISEGADVNFAAKHNITPLHVASKWGRKEMVRLLLAKNANIAAMTRDGLTPLHCAARSGHLNLLELLLADTDNQKNLIEMKTKNGLSALHMAAQGGHDDVLKYLLVNNANVNDVTIDLLTPLHVAAHCGHLNVAQTLINFGANVNGTALNGFTALHIACKKKKYKIVELLLKHGASVMSMTESGLTPLHVACFTGCINIVSLLLKQPKGKELINKSTVKGETPLHIAVRSKQKDVISFLLQHEANVNCEENEGQTPLHLATKLLNSAVTVSNYDNKNKSASNIEINNMKNNGNKSCDYDIIVQIIKLLILNGANLNATTKDEGYSPLHLAAKYGCVSIDDKDSKETIDSKRHINNEIIKMLIDTNAPNINSRTLKKYTCLHLACKYGRCHIVDCLIKSGADINAKGRNDLTPLYIATQYKHFDVVEILLKNKASLNASHSNGYNPLHVAASMNNIELCQLFLEYNSEAANWPSKKGSYTPLHIAVAKNNLELTKLLLKYAANVNAKAANGVTPLHIASQSVENTEIAALLIINDADVFAETETGFTPLHVASYYGTIDIAKLILQKHSDRAIVDVETHSHYTPLHHATQQGHLSIVTLLLKHNANSNVLTNNGMTPRQIAALFGYQEIHGILNDVKENSLSDDITVTEYNQKDRPVSRPELMDVPSISDSEDENNLVANEYLLYPTYMTNQIFKTSYGSPGSNSLLEKDQNSILADNLSLISLSGTSTNKNESSKLHNPVNKISIKMGFLVSFLVDARGGSMCGERNPNVKILVPSKSCSQPTRITCRFVKLEKILNPPILMEGEALVSKIMELSPVNNTFLGPVIIEFPHFGSLRNSEREIIILRSDNGSTWTEHFNSDISEDFLDSLSSLDSLKKERKTRIITTKFPYYFACVSRIKQEIHIIGPEGGVIESKIIKNVKATFPQNALTKKIKVGLQVHSSHMDSHLINKNTENYQFTASPVVTIEPRRRKFHKAITLNIPAPVLKKNDQKSKLNSTKNLRLLCSITGGQNRSNWEDVTGSTPLNIMDNENIVSFTTTVSARFWIINRSNGDYVERENDSDTSQMVSDLYSQIIAVPFIAKFIIYAKRINKYKVQFLVCCNSDEKDSGYNFLHQNFYHELVVSEEIEVIENQEFVLKFSERPRSNPHVIKQEKDINLLFRPYNDNKKTFVVPIPFTHEINDDSGRNENVSSIFEINIFTKYFNTVGSNFSKKVLSLSPLSLDKLLEDEETRSQKKSMVSIESEGRKNKINLYHLIDENDAINSKNNSKLSFECEITDSNFAIADFCLKDVSESLGEDWIKMAHALQLSIEDIELVRKEFPGDTHKQALVALRLWMNSEKNKSIGEALQLALIKIGRSDVIENVNLC